MKLSILKCLVGFCLLILILVDLQVLVKLFTFKVQGNLKNASKSSTAFFVLKVVTSNARSSV